MRLHPHALPCGLLFLFFVACGDDRASASGLGSPASGPEVEHDGGPDASRDVDAPEVIGETTILAKDRSSPSALAIGGGRIYWADTFDAQIVSCPITGCPVAGPEIVASNQVVFARGLHYKDGTLYWVTPDSGVDGGTSGALRKCVATGCNDAPTDLATGLRDARIMTLDADNAYFAERGANAISRCPLTGCGSSPTHLVPTGAADVRGLTVDGDNVYWTTYGGTTETAHVYTCNRTSCTTPTRLDGTYASLAATGVLVHGGNVIWGDGQGIFSCPIAGCSGAPAVLHRQSSNVNQLAVSNGTLYFLQGGLLMRIALGTPSPTAQTLTVQKILWDMALDDAYVYWTQLSELNDGIVGRTKR